MARVSACPLALLLLALLGLPAPALAAPDEPLVPPAIEGIVLDGRPDEEAWSQAASLPLPAVRVPQPTGERTATRAPEVRMGVDAGRLVFGIRMAEDPGASIGMHLMVAPEGTRSAAEAVSIDVRPMSMRAPRYRAIGPRGVGRSHYRIEAVADITRAGVWTLEGGIPVRDLVDGEATRKLRMALVVYTRTQNVIAAWPGAAVWGAPARWAAVHPPEGGWPLEVSVDTERLEAEDAADAARQAAWLAYLKGAATPVLPVKPAEELRGELHAQLVAPLEEVARRRPDLAVPVDCLLGDVFRRLGMLAAAEARYQDALDAAPGWREAAYGLYVKVRGSGAAMGTPGEPTDHARARARLDARFDPAAHPAAASYVADGRALAEAMLAYKAGNAEEAVPALTRLAERYPFDALIDSHRRLALRLQRAAAEEKRLVAADALKTLPRATIDTTAGKIVLELFQDDARNTVFNFVYLARQGFYDGCAVHRTVPFFVAQTGDPYTRPETDQPELVGAGTPGYAIRTELGPRWPLRGYVAMANGGPNTDGSQFMLLTGTAVHLRGEVTVFARVVEGQEVVDRLRAGDEPTRIRGIAFEGLDPERTYHPSTLAGNRAPAPKAPEIR